MIHHRRLQILCVLAEQLCRQQNRVDNLLISCTAADIAADRKGSLVAGRIRILVNQPLCTHHHAGDAEAALHGSRFSKGIDKYFFFPVTEPFYCYDGFSLHL